MAWLDRCERGEAGDFETLCGEQAEIAEELRHLSVRYERALKSLTRLNGPIDERDGDGRHGSSDASGAESRGTAEPRYEIRGEIARGGMGVILDVYEPSLRRSLAMKKLDRPAGTGLVDRVQRERRESRLLAEAQILGQLDHPGIVPVHEVGTDRSGELYFTMQRVRGREFGAIIDAVGAPDREWTLARAIGVLLRVAEAVAYAHSKGVVHRDLKPSNVMVGRFGETYVMDWGLARALAKAAGEPDALHAPSVGMVARDETGEASGESSPVRTSRSEESDSDSGSPLVTGHGEVVGTPAYMPPEQAAGEIDAVDARADVYALGAMLYHLLAGRRPYALEEGESSAAETLAAVLSGPPVPLASIATKLPDDLVAVAEKAMARDPAQRYASMEALGADLRAWLEGRVVSAHESGRFAELRKWVRRNPALTAWSAIALAAVVLGLGGVVLVESRGKEQLKAENAKVLRANASSEEVIELLTRMFEYEDPDVAQGAELPVRTVLDRARERLKTELAGEPRTRARLAQALGRVDLSTGAYPSAAQMLDLAAELHAANPPDDPAAVFECGRHRALVEQALGELQAARRRLEELAPRASTVLGPDHAATLEVRAALGLVLAAQYEFRAAEDVQRDVAQRFESGFGADHRRTLAVQTDRARSLIELGRYDEARGTLEEAVASYERLGTMRSRDGLAAKLALAVCRNQGGDPAAALPIYTEVVDAQRSRLQPGHTDLLTAVDGRAIALQRLGRLSDAEAAFREVVDAYETRGKPASDLLVTSLFNLSQCFFFRGALEDARATLERALAAVAAMHKPSDDFNRLAVLNLLLMVDMSLQRTADLAAHSRELVTAFESSRGKLDLKKLAFFVPVAFARWRAGDKEGSVTWLEVLTEEMRRQNGESHASYQYARYELARMLCTVDRSAEADEILRDVIAYHRRQGAGPDLISVLAQRRHALLGLGRTDDALAAAREAVELAQKTLPPEDMMRIRPELELADLWMQLARWGEARSLVERVLDELPPGHPARKDLEAKLDRIATGESASLK